MFPDKVCVFFDVENSFDPAWARLLGVDTDKLVVIRPSFGEQLVDMIESALYTEDCGLVALDSIAAVITTAEMEKSAEGAQVGGATLLIGKLFRKTNLALAEADKKGRHPTLIYINQVRSKVGVIYGNPETMPGGNAPKFQANIILRVYGKNEMDTKISSTMPVKKEVKFVVNKWKCPILSASGTFSMATLPHAGLKVGQCADFNTISEYLKAWGKFEKAEEGLDDPRRALRHDRAVQDEDLRGRRLRGLGAQDDHRQDGGDRRPAAGPGGGRRGMTPAQKLEMLRSLDVEKALSLAPAFLEGGWKDDGVWADQRETALAGLHKARLRQPAHFTAKERAASREWLLKNGWRLT